MNKYLFTLAILIFVPMVTIGTFHVSYPVASVGSLAVNPPTVQQIAKKVVHQATLSKSTEREFNSLVFVGDVLLARNVEYLMEQHGADYPFSGLDLKSLAPNPAIVGNFEAAVPEVHVPTPVGKIDFSVPESALPALYRAGYTHLSLANNHSLDFGDEGYKHTAQSLNSQMSAFGHETKLDTNSISFLSVNDKEVALIGLNVFSTFSHSEISNLLRISNLKSDIQIVFIHWGEEYALRHNNSQTELATFLIEGGADLVIGHHPHVVQGVDVINNVPVFYSLGNYIFDQYFSKDVQEGLVLSLDLEGDSRISLIPVKSAPFSSRPEAMSQSTHVEFLDTLSRKSHESLQDTIRRGYVPFMQEIATSSKIAMIDSINYVQ